MHFTPRKLAVASLALSLTLAGSIGTAVAARGNGVANGNGNAPAAKPATPAAPAAAAGKSNAASAAASVPAPFTEALAFATKTGFRGVVTWSASSPVSATVRWGASPDSMDQTLIVPDAPDTAGVAVIDNLEIGQTYYVSIEDRVSGVVAGPLTLKAANAYNNYDPASGTYTLNALVQLDSQSLPAEIPSDQALEDIAKGMNVFAERVYDAVDKHARLGHVLVTDTQIAYAVNEPFAVEETFVPTSDLNPCGADRNLADVLIQTSVPFDSHTFLWAIDEPCTSFYVGREGQLVTPWEGDLHFGYVATHEMMHYAFGAPDLYSPSDLTGQTGCKNTDWDGSLMHNTGGWAGNQWELTELDRSPTQTPCDHQHDSVYTWDSLQTRYTEIPDGIIDHVVDVLPRGNADGGALDIRILDRTPAMSTLTSYTPDDSNPELNPGTCAADLRSTSFGDPTGDATLLLGNDTGAAPLNDPALDIVQGGLTYSDVDGDNKTSAADTLTFTVTADDLKETPPVGAEGEYFDFQFTIGTAGYYASAEWNHLRGEPTFELGRFEVTRSVIAPVSGTWNLETDEVTFVIPAVIPGEKAGDPPLFQAESGARITGLSITSRRMVGVIVPDADTASGGCALRTPGDASDTPPPPPPPGVPTEPDATLAGGDTATLKGTVRQNNSSYDDCVDNLEDPRCNVFMVEVNPADGTGVLEFDVTADDDPLEDFDVYVYDMDREQVGFAAFLGPADAAAFPVDTGRYYVQVVPYDAGAGSSFTLGLALLSR